MWISSPSGTHLEGPVGIPRTGFHHLREGIPRTLTAWNLEFFKMCMEHEVLVAYDGRGGGYTHLPR